jgi:ketopantoate reductase
VVNGIEIGVIGPGAVGTVLGGLLCAAGHRVTFYGRAATRPRHSLSLEDQAGNRKEITGFSWANLDRWNPRTEITLVCVRGDQLASVLAGMQGRAPHHATLAVASATLDPLTATAREAGWRGAILRVGIGFGAWRRDDGVYRWFPMLPIGSGIASEGDRSVRPAQEQLTRALSGAGLAARAAPGRLFHWFMRTAFALQTAQCLGFARAGWSLDELARDVACVEDTARAMRQAARVIWTEGGPPGLVAATAPLWIYRRMLRSAPGRASRAFKEVWRHHGPKIWPQVRFLTDQLEARGRARGVPTDAISTLAAAALLG